MSIACIVAASACWFWKLKDLKRKEGKTNIVTVSLSQNNVTVTCYKPELHIPPLYVVYYYYVVPSISLLVDLMVELTDVLFQTRKPNWVILTNWNNRSA